MAVSNAERKAKWKTENRDKYVSGYKKYTEQNKEKKAEYDRKRREQNRGEYLKSKREYYESHKEAHKAYQLKTKDHRKEIMDKWKSEHNAEINTKRRVYARERKIKDADYAIKSYIRISFRRMVSNGKTWHEFFDLCGYSYSDYIEYFDKHFKEEYEKYRRTKEYHIDHIIPCALYNFTDGEDVRKCWNPRNLRIISAKENMGKGAKLEIALVKQYGIMDLLPKGWRVNG